jgi:hypothetical protein
VQRAARPSASSSGRERQVASEYARRLYERIVVWYESAERQAQLILALDGVFLSFLVGSVFSDPSELQSVVARFGPETWALLALMSLALVASIGCAIACLYSRIYSSAELDEIYGNEGVDPADPDTHTPEVMWFFQMIGGLDSGAFVNRVLTVDNEFEIRAVASNCIPLARNVANKHRWVNYGFFGAGLVLVLFLLSGISYTIRAT